MTHHNQAKLAVAFLVVTVVLFGVFVKAMRHRRNYALYSEARKQKPDLSEMERLIAHGANVNVRINAHMDGGWTPLHGAVGGDGILWKSRERIVPTVRFLLDKGADIDARDGNGRTVLMEVSWVGYAEVVQFLLENGANPNIRDDFNSTALSRVRDNLKFNSAPAKKSDYVETIRLLKRTGARE